MKNRKTYEIKMPDGKKMKIWFIGPQLELLLKAYNIEYKIVRR